jgi:hypothetical protein
MGIDEWGLILHGHGGKDFKYFEDKGILPCRDSGKQADEELMSRLSMSQCGGYLKVKRGYGGDWVVDLKKFHLAPIRICFMHYFTEGGSILIWEHPISYRHIRQISFADGETATVAFPFLRPGVVESELAAYEWKRREQIERLRGIEEYAAKWIEEPAVVGEGKEFTVGQRRFACGCLLVVGVAVAIWISLFVWGLFH